MYISKRSRTWVSSSIRKDKPVGQILGSGFSWSEAVDAAAEIYNGVSSPTWCSSCSYADTMFSSSSGRC